MVLADRSRERRYRFGPRMVDRDGAEVYQASAPSLGRSVAIKRRIETSEEGVRRAIREATILAILDHPNIAEVLDLGAAESEYYLVTEFVDGPSLREVLEVLAPAKARLPVELVCGIVGQVCRGLAHAHERSDPDGKGLGIVHRELSADRVLVDTGGVVKITDFGSASMAGHELTAPGTTAGRSPRVLAPEQAAGAPVDVRTDVFGLGALMFELLAGEPLVRGDGLAALRRIMAGEFGALAERLAGVDPDLVAIVERCVKKDPALRFHSAREVERRLDRFRAARQLRVDAQALAELTEELAPRVTRLRADRLSLGDLEGSELVFPPEGTHDPEPRPARVSLPPPGAAPRAPKRPRLTPSAPPSIASARPSIPSAPPPIPSAPPPAPAPTTPRAPPVPAAPADREREVRARAPTDPEAGPREVPWGWVMVASLLGVIAILLAILVSIW